MRMAFCGKKLVYASLFCIMLGFGSCEKKVDTAHEDTGLNISQKQSPVTLYSDQGEMIELMYFGKGDEVAVQITVNQQSPQELVAISVNENGSPVFGNEIYKWEMGQDPRSGTLTKKGEEPIAFSVKE